MTSATIFEARYCIIFCCLRVLSNDVDCALYLSFNY